MHLCLYNHAQNKSVSVRQLPSMDAKRELIIDLHKKNIRNIDIFRKLCGIGVNKKLISRTIKRFKETGTFRTKKKPGRNKSIRTPKLIKVVRERIRRNPAQSGSKMAKDLNVSQSTMQRVLKHDLGLIAYKKQRVHGLTGAQKTARVNKCRYLLQWHDGDEIIFSDEKLFLLQDSHNQQNDRVYASTLADAPKSKLAIERYQNTSGVMVWGGISRKGKLPLLFIDKGVKINQEYYISNVLENHLLVHAKEMYGEDYFCFQQDSAPAHKAKRTQAWCKENLPDFISSEEWPASSPDLNPLDYCVWGYMLAKLGSTRGMNVIMFKKRLIQIWDEIPDDVVRASCDAFFKRLRLVVKEKGERFELNM